MLDTLKNCRVGSICFSNTLKLSGWVLSLLDSVGSICFSNTLKQCVIADISDNVWVVFVLAIPSNTIISLMKIIMCG